VPDVFTAILTVISDEFTVHLSVVESITVDVSIVSTTVTSITFDLYVLAVEFAINSFDPSNIFKHLTCVSLEIAVVSANFASI